MVDLMMMLVELGLMIVFVIVRAQFEYVRKRWEEEQNELQQHFLSGSHTNDQR